MSAHAPYPPYPVGNDQPPPYQQHQSTAPQATPVTRVELHVSCRNLLDLDTFSKSDPIVVMFVQEKQTKKWREYGRTEIIWNNLNPDFAKSFIIDYFFEEIQKLKFEVYDVDSKSNDLSKHDFIGSMECTLGAIFGVNNGSYEVKLRNPKFAKCGNIIVSAEEVSSCKDVAILHFSGSKLDKKDFFGKSDPFLSISRCNEDSTFTVVHRTETKKTTLKPTWLPFKIPARILCNGDYDRTLRIECFDWNKNGNHSLIGQFQTSLRDLTSFRTGRSSYDLIHPKRKSKKKSYKNSGYINVIDCQVHKKFSFLDYIRSGTELNFVVAVDFTASNGNPSNQSSLHYINPYSPNQYTQALQAVGRIIEDYDADKLFPAFGFGAKCPPRMEVSHQFPLNGNNMNPMCGGVDGILAAYYNSIQVCQLYGPTNFAPVINNTAQIAGENFRRDPAATYFVLLIITDGIITDMERTKDAIFEAAKLPVSIIIVGVGPAEFDSMEELDGDAIRLTNSRGQEAERDIVQFVPFRDYIGRDGKYDENSGARLAKDVLAELPEQLEEFMDMKKVQPKIPPSR